jgi:ribosomal protein L37AE/L43A
MANDDRNPLFIPGRKGPQPQVCPKCQSNEWDGRIVQGVSLRTCRKCGMRWQGGLPQQPIAPGTTLPPETYVPTVRFTKNSKGEDVEHNRRVDTRPDFKKGAPITED